MSERKIRNDLPEALSKEEMMEKINQTLDRVDYSTVYLTLVMLQLCEEDN